MRSKEKNEEEKKLIEELKRVEQVEYLPYLELMPQRYSKKKKENNSTCKNS